MKNAEPWLKKIRENLKDYTEPLPPNDGWERIEKDLSALPHPMRTLRPTLLRRWWRVGVAAALLAGVSATGIWLATSDKPTQTEQPQTADVLQPAVQTVPEEPTLPPEAEADQRHAWIARLTEPTAPSALIEQPTPPYQETTEDGQAETEIPPTEDKDTEVSQPDTDPQPAEQHSRPVRRETALPTPTETTQTKRHSGWSLGLSVGNTTATSPNGSENHVVLSNTPPSYASNSNQSELVTATEGMLTIPKGQALVFMEGTPYLVEEGANVVSADHKQPITVGFSVRKLLKKGFSVETGLNYTYLASDILCSGCTESVSQKLHYVGIPLRVNWNFWENQRFSVYVAAGGSVEKCVYAKIGSETETVNPLQFSVMGTFGAQVNMSRRVGIYVEPGVSYYFNDGSNLATIRKEHPFNFNLQAGVRFTY